VTVGARIPRITNTTVTSTGTTNTIAMENVGMIFKVQPRINVDRTIVMAINVTQSGMGPESEGTPLLTTGDKVIRTPRLENAEVYATVTVPDGQTAVLGAITRQDKSDKQLVIIVTPRILGPEGTMKSQ
jgi:type II secretory pathway component GspD/PulD (secretin)